MDLIGLQTALDEARDQVVLSALKFTSAYYATTDDYTWLEEASDDLNSVLKEYAEAFNKLTDFQASQKKPKITFFLQPEVP